MGRFIQIRVSATTFAIEEAEKAFALLYAAAWPLGSYKATDRKGLVELVAQLADMAQFGDMAKDAREVVKKHLARLQGAVHDLEAALADWKPLDAERCSTVLEELLAELEAAMPKAD